MPARTANALFLQNSPDRLSKHELKLTVNHLLVEGRADLKNQRAHRREPFFKLVSISTAQEPRLRFTGYSRDISTNGMGLVHFVQLGPGPVIITIYSDTLGPVRIAAEIVWCNSIGDGWFASGLRFLNSLGSE